jgi:transcriptional regulator with XRE-family HTH domain
MAKKTSNKSTTMTDGRIGQIMRVHRLSKGMTQTELGAELGVTFQQVQKYEKGTNRVGSGRLYQIAEILEVPVTAFFEGEKASRAGGASPFAMLAEPMTLQVLKEFSQIRDKGARRSVLALVEQMVSAGKR